MMFFRSSSSRSRSRSPEPVKQTVFITSFGGESSDEDGGGGNVVQGPALPPHLQPAPPTTAHSVSDKLSRSVSILPDFTTTTTTSTRGAKIDSSRLTLRLFITYMTV